MARTKVSPRGRLVVLAVATAVGLPMLPAAAADTGSIAAAEPVRLAPDLPTRSYFGAAVASSGDTVLVGASHDDAAATRSGSAFVYIAAEGGWAEQAELVPDDGAQDDYFGEAVAIDGDTAVIGAPSKDSGDSSDAGSAYVFVRSGSTWTQQAKLVPSALGTFSYAGESVAVQGDVAFVGHAGEAGDGDGAVSVFTRSGTTWTEQAVLADLETDQGYGFGAALAVDGDTLVVGQSVGGYQVGEPQYNSAYVFVGSGASWTLQDVLATAEVGLADLFAAAVAVKGDTVVVGATDCSAGGVEQSGCAYVFQRTGTTWAEQALLVGSAAEKWDRFGRAVAVDGKTIVVGAERYDGADGAALVFRRSGTTWTEQRVVVNPDPRVSFEFGWSIALERQASGQRTLVIGARGYDHSRGAAYVYR